MQNHAAGLMRWIFGYRAYEDMGSHVDYRFSTLEKLIMNMIRSLAKTTLHTLISFLKVVQKALFEWLHVSINSHNKAIVWHFT